MPLSGAAQLAYPRKSRDASRRNKSKRLHQSVNKRHCARNCAQGNEALPCNRYRSWSPLSLACCHLFCRSCIVQACFRAHCARSEHTLDASVTVKRANLPMWGSARIAPSRLRPLFDTMRQMTSKQAAPHRRDTSERQRHSTV